MVDGVNNMEVPIRYRFASEDSIRRPMLNVFYLQNCVLVELVMSVFQLHSCIWLTVARGMVCVFKLISCFYMLFFG
jgi:hypothetical protein